MKSDGQYYYICVLVVASSCPTKNTEDTFYFQTINCVKVIFQESQFYFICHRTRIGELCLM